MSVKSKQRPSSMILPKSDLKRDMPVPERRLPPASAQMRMTDIPPLPLPKRRRIRPISSLVAKKTNFPICFLEDPHASSKAQDPPTPEQV